MTQWPFTDRPDTAILTVKRILSKAGRIGYVTHDRDDGAWQFLELNNQQPSTADGAVVSLMDIVELDPSVIDLADLPLGWHAWRATKESVWTRAQQS